MSLMSLAFCPTVLWETPKCLGMSAAADQPHGQLARVEHPLDALAGGESGRQVHLLHVYRVEAVGCVFSHRRNPEVFVCTRSAVNSIQAGAGVSSRTSTCTRARTACSASSSSCAVISSET